MACDLCGAGRINIHYAKSIFWHVNLTWLASGMASSQQFQVLSFEKLCLQKTAFCIGKLSCPGRDQGAVCHTELLGVALPLACLFPAECITELGVSHLEPYCNSLLIPMECKTGSSWQHFHIWRKEPK